MNVAELLQAVPDAANTKVTGLLIGCIIDTSIGELSFLAAGQDTGIRFQVLLLKFVLAHHMRCFVSLLLAGPWSYALSCCICCTNNYRNLAI